MPPQCSPWTIRFSNFARGSARALGHPISFVVASSTFVLWLVLGPVFHFSDTWQLVMATGSSAITVLMVFVLQNSQNRESQAMQVKLDELIRAAHDADDAVVSAETMTVAELEAMSARYTELAREVRAQRAQQEATLEVEMPQNS